MENEYKKLAHRTLFTGVISSSSPRSYKKAGLFCEIVLCLIYTIETVTKCYLDIYVYRCLEDFEIN